MRSRRRIPRDNVNMRYKERIGKPDHMEIEKWSILTDVFKYVQYNQYSFGHYKIID